MIPPRLHRTKDELSPMQQRFNGQTPSDGQNVAKANPKGQSSKRGLQVE
jgi:hypothetical protein